MVLKQLSVGSPSVMVAPGETWAQGNSACPHSIPQTPAESLLRARHRTKHHQQSRGFWVGPPRDEALTQTKSLTRILETLMTSMHFIPNAKQNLRRV